MSGPFIFISRSRVKPGRWEQALRHASDATEIVETEEPRVIGLHTWADEGRSEVSTVQVHPDAESMESHLKIYVDKLAESAFEALDTYEIDVLGTPGQGLLDLLSQVQDVQVRILPEHLSGFLRPQPL
jgi:hypothetical protein